jgi:molecular chaperone GrpE
VLDRLAGGSLSADEPEDDARADDVLEGAPLEVLPEVLPEPVVEASEVPEESAVAAPSGGLEAALEPPPELDEAAAALRRAHLAEDRLNEVLAAYRQAKSENEGFRERTQRNVERKFEQRRERLLLKFIDILDNLDRALEAAESSHAANPLIEGLILVRTQLLQTLQEEGLERIPVLGLPFDPNFSEAVATAPVDDPDHHHVVVKELMRGYRLNGRVARASRVLIGDHSKPAPVEIPSTDLIGADELPLEAEPDAEADLPEAALLPALDDEASLEEIIAEAHAEPAAPTQDEEPVSLGDVLLEPEEKD